MQSAIATNLMTFQSCVCACVHVCVSMCLPIPTTIQIESNPNLLLSNQVTLSLNPILKGKQSQFKSNRDLIAPITGSSIKGAVQHRFSWELVTR